MIDAGQRDKRILIQSPAPGGDGYGGRNQSFAPYGSAWARVRYGTADERREAAQEAAVQTATFALEYSARWAAISEIFQIVHGGATWDIKSVVPLGNSENIQITAVRKK